MKALILAAGEGTRLRPFTLDRPKCLVEVEGMSLLDRQVEVLHSEKITDITLIGGYRSDMLEPLGLNLKINPRYAETNMVWSLFCAKEELCGEILIAYGDIVYSRKTLRALLESKADIAVAVDLDWERYWCERHENPIDDAETLRLDAKDRLLEIGQKPMSIDQIEGQYMGVMKFSAKGIRVLCETYSEGLESGSIGGKNPEKCYMTDLLQMIIDKNTFVQAVTTREPWVEIDSVSDLQLKATSERLRKIKADI